MKAVLTRASDLNAGNPQKHYIILEDLEGISKLLMTFEEPLLVMFAAEVDAPAELEIMIYDDFIETEEI